MSSSLDLSPKTLREVEFREKLRGYHPDDVDDFLERVAAGLETLLDRLREANDRANRLEARATDRVDDDDSLKRTLVLAQRTADLAVQEAQESAAQTLAAAEEEARALLARAESHANELLRMGEEQLREDLKRLEAARNQMLVDLDELSAWMDGERNRLRVSLSDALAHIEDAIPVVGAAPQQAPADIPAEGLQWGEPAPAPLADPAVDDDQAAFVLTDEGAGPDATTR
ncbi:MAG TPA: DivIVA domain-containing protein [Acidimicrobiales bacterium]|nr:DivIVA domain-containing protein [Acidimicrobiales bacterium]